MPSFSSFPFYVVQYIPFLPPSYMTSHIFATFRQVATLDHSIKSCFTYSKPTFNILCTHHWIKHIGQYIFT